MEETREYYKGEFKAAYWQSRCRSAEAKAERFQAILDDVADETGLTAEAVSRGRGERLLTYIRDMKWRLSDADLLNRRCLELQEENEMFKRGLSDGPRPQCETADYWRAKVALRDASVGQLRFELQEARNACASKDREIADLQALDFKKDIKLADSNLKAAGLTREVETLKEEVAHQTRRAEHANERNERQAYSLDDLIRERDGLRAANADSDREIDSLAAEVEKRSRVIDIIRRVMHGETFHDMQDLTLGDLMFAQECGLVPLPDDAEEPESLREGWVAGVKDKDGERLWL